MAVSKIDYDVIVIGCGLSGAVVARELAEKHNKRVLILDRREHIGGNMYDYVDQNGILVHKYGPHTFHTKKRYLYEYIQQFADWSDYRLTCGAVIDGKFTPTPFNFQTIDDFFEGEKAGRIKRALRDEYPDQEFVSVAELLGHKNELIKEYAAFLYDKDYSLYTAKQWGVSPDEIDPSILKRVPIRLNYDIGYFDDDYQVMPAASYMDFFSCLLGCDNITVQLNTPMSEVVKIDFQAKELIAFGEQYEGIIVYTGALDELLECKYGTLPYRSLRFEWRRKNIASFQAAPVVAYPQAEGYTRITEYTKLPYQNVGEKTCYAVEYPLPYAAGVKAEPYYPVLTEESQRKYNMYLNEMKQFKNVYLCGRLADFKYYNMDQALERALNVVDQIMGDVEK